MVRVLYIFCAFLVSEVCSAQINRCSTTEYNEFLAKSDPAGYVEMMKSRNVITVGTGATSENKTQGSVVITIPVVVHVIWNTSVQNISETQVQSQIDVLNDDFRKLNTDASNVPVEFQSVAADCEINFCLAKRDPGNNPTDGITRTFTNTTAFSFSNEMKFNSSGGHDIWDRNRYLNLWVCNLPGTLGFTQLPGGPASTDGVVIRYNSFGSTGTLSAPYDKGRTATHEVGHWLGLEHTFLNGCTGSTPATCTSQGDFVCDTPPSSSENFGCPNTQNTCAETPVNQNDMTMNFMDYTDDACMNMFSEGQKTRMHTTINTIRIALPQSNGCEDPNAGIANKSSLRQINIYPVPASELLYIDEIPSRFESELKIYDCYGRLIFERLIPASDGKGDFMIDCRTFPKGVYSAELVNDSGQFFKKIILE